MTSLTGKPLRSSGYALSYAHHAIQVSCAQSIDGDGQRYNNVLGTKTVFGVKSFFQATMVGTNPGETLDMPILICSGLELGYGKGKAKR